MRHTFTINGQPHTLSDMTLLATFSIINLVRVGADASSTSVGNRVMAIKHLRSVSGLGLFESKHIVDFVAEYGKIRSNGEVYIERDVPVISYTPGT